MATPTANLDAGPILAPTESPSTTSTATPAFTGTSSDAAKQNTKMSNLYLCVSYPPLRSSLHPGR